MAFSGHLVKEEFEQNKKLQRDKKLEQYSGILEKVQLYVDSKTEEETVKTPDSKYHHHIWGGLGFALIGLLSIAGILLLLVYSIKKLNLIGSNRELAGKVELNLTVLSKKWLHDSSKVASCTEEDVSFTTRCEGLAIFAGRGIRIDESVLLEKDGSCNFLNPFNQTGTVQFPPVTCNLNNISICTDMLQQACDLMLKSKSLSSLSNFIIPLSMIVGAGITLGFTVFSLRQGVKHFGSFVEAREACKTIHAQVLDEELDVTELDLDKEQKIALSNLLSVDGKRKNGAVMGNIRTIITNLSKHPDADEQTALMMYRR